MNNTKRKYTMSEKAKAQRANAPKKLSAAKDWVAVHISRDNYEWAKEKFGTANAAMDYAREYDAI